MSEKDFKRLLSDLERDEGLRGAVEALRPEGYEGSEIPVDALLAFARERGYEIDADDIAPRVAELDESDLEQVAGGTLRQTTNSVDSSTASATYGKWIDILSWSGGYDWHK